MHLSVAAIVQLYSKMASHATESISFGNGSKSNATLRNANSDATPGMASKLERYLEIGTSVHIVGSAIGGLMTVLEGWRKGLSVNILERSAGPVYIGELEH